MMSKERIDGLRRLGPVHGDADEPVGRVLYLDVLREDQEIELPRERLGKRGRHVEPRLFAGLDHAQIGDHPALGREPRRIAPA